MRLRAAQLALVMLLLSSLGAGGSATRERFSLGNLQARAMQQQGAQSAVVEAALSQSLDDAAITGPVASPEPLRAAWQMRPPAAHSAHTHAVTASLA
jgi:hypothetical protein